MSSSSSITRLASVKREGGSVNFCSAVTSFASRISPAELQEGDMSISRAYLTWQTKLLARQENVSWTPEYHAEKAPNIEIPQEFEFRPRPGII